MDALLRFVTGQRLLVILAAAVCAGLGVRAWRALPVDAFPDTTNVQAMILAEAPGLSPVDVERQISFPIELVMKGLPGVREIRSLSKASFSQVVVVFEDDVDTYFARQLVFERLASVVDQLPEGVEPELGPISTGLGEIFQYTLESDDRDVMELRTLQDWVVAPQLKEIAGVNEVNSFGGFVKQYQVMVQPESLLKFGITLQDVVAAVAGNNANAGGSYILKGWEQTYVRSVGLIRGMQDLEDIVLQARDGTPVLLHDVAEVTIGSMTRQGAVTRDAGGEVVAGMVIMLKGANAKDVVERVRARLPAVQQTLPDDVRFNVFYDRTGLVEACVATVSSALMQGAALVVLVLILFLWNLRAALIVAISLPLTALLTFIFMDLAEVSANLMSLGGLAIAVGMMVDGSIVVTENTVRHLRRGGRVSPAATVYAATREVARPVLFAILIIVVVFLPLFALEQMEGKLFKPLALTMIFAMIASLIVALTVVPALLALGLRPRSGGERGIGPLIQRLYAPLLDRILARPWFTVVGGGVLLGLAALLTPLVGTEFLPSLDEGSIAINAVRLPSASLEGSVEVARALEKRLLTFPEVETVVTKTGRAEISEDPMGPEQSDLFVMLHPQDGWTSGRSKDQLVTAMQEKLAEVPGLRLAFSQPIALRVNELISGIKSDVAIKILGEDLEVLRAAAEELSAILNRQDGATDVRVEQSVGFSQLEVAIDRRAIARYRLNVADVNALITTAVGGQVATEVVEGSRRFGVQVRYPADRRRDLESIGSLVLTAPDGARVPLAQVAELREVEGPAQISRQDGMRRVVVECNVRDRDLGSFIAELEAALGPVRAGLPVGYRIDVGGQFENQRRAMARLAWVVPLSVALIFLFLVSAFGSVRRALLVLLNLPFAMLGGLVVLVVAEIPLSVSAVVGFIALFGIAVENGVVLITFIGQRIDDGTRLGDAVRDACLLRARPLLMTSATTLLGLAPLLLATGSGAEIQRPLAAVMLGGLVTSTLLTLVVLPVLFLAVEARFQAGARGARGEPGAPGEARPASA